MNETNERTVRDECISLIVLLCHTSVALQVALTLDDRRKGVGGGGGGDRDTAKLWW